MNGDRGMAVLNQFLNEARGISAIVVPEHCTIFDEAEKYNSITILKITDVNNLENVNKLASYGSDIFVVAGYPVILKQQVLNLPKFGVINLHGGPLPGYRGGSPLNWQIINDEKEIGVSLIFMNEGIDTGDILGQRYFDLEELDDIHTVHEKANKCFVELLSNVLRELEDNTLKPISQNHSKAHYWVQRNNQDSFVDWRSVSARQAYNMIRALKPPYPSAFTYANNQKLFLKEAGEDNVTPLDKLTIRRKEIEAKEGEVIVLAEN